MSDSQFQYGVGHTSVKMHQPPGGSTSINLGWDEPSRPPPAQRWNNAAQREPMSNIFSNQQPPMRQEKNIFPQNFPNFNNEPQLPPQQRDIYQPQDQFQVPMPNFKVDLYSQPPDPRPFNQPDMARNHFMKESPPNYYQRQQMSNNNQGMQNYSQPTRIEPVRPEFIQRQEPMYQSPPIFQSPQMQPQMQRGEIPPRSDINQFPPVQRPDFFQREVGYQGAPAQRSGPGTRERPADPYRGPNQYDPYQQGYQPQQGYQQPQQNYRQEEPRGSPNYQQDFDMKPSVRVSNPPGGRSNFTFG